MKETFSTGSQAQYPPHPRTSYDQAAPSVIPAVKNNQGYAGDNDIDDLIGYLILYKIAKLGWFFSRLGVYSNICLR